MFREALVIRLHFDPKLSELVRLVGYAGLPLDEAREKVKPLEAKYGAAAIQRAANEVIRIDANAKPPWV